MAPTPVKERPAGGQAIPSPDEERTPAYYRDGRFPAWFKLHQFREVDRREFEVHFGAVPSLDPTLYEVIREEGGIRVVPGPTWHLRPVETKGDAIVHISDLHFGEGHGYPYERSASGRGLETRTLAEVVSAALRKFIDVPIGAVVVSGDFISKGDANAYSIAEGFVSHLLRSVGLAKEHCVLVPGNHDLWTLGKDHPTRSYEHEAPYRSFIRSLLLEEVQDLERVYRLRTPKGIDLVFISLNSARIRSDELKEYGYVSRHRYEDLLEYVSSTLLSESKDGRKSVVFAVLHHHVVPVARVETPADTRPVSLTLDAGELIEEFGNAGVGYVLHGHEHVPFVGIASKLNRREERSASWRSTRGNIFILGCGSTGAKWDWLPREIGRNIISVYVPEGKRLKIMFIAMLPGQPPSMYWTGSVPLQFIGG